MTTNPPISVIMSVYNGVKYLHDAIGSILKQTFTDFEFVIVNDGSTDDTDAILRSYDDARLRIISLERNEGVAAARDRALNATSGKYIAVLDADDMALPERLAIQIAWLDEHPDVGVLGSGVRMMDADGALTGRVYSFSAGHDEILSNILHAKGLGITHSSVMMRRDVTLRAGGYNARLPITEDISLWLCCSAVSQLHVIADVLCLYRRHDENISGVAGATRQQNGILSRICYYLRQAGLPDPSTGPDEEWEAFRNTVISEIEKSGLERVNAARDQLAAKVFNKSGSRKYAKLAATLLLNPRLAIGLRYKSRWRRLIDELVAQSID